jgi:hypothetical protein
MTALKELLERTGCADELVDKPNSWEQLMTAVAAGAIDNDELDEIVIHCAALANQATPGELWDGFVMDALFAMDGDVSSGPSRALIDCGKAADRWQRGEN